MRKCIKRVLASLLTLTIIFTTLGFSSKQASADTNPYDSSLDELSVSSSVSAPFLNANYTYQTQYEPFGAQGYLKFTLTGASTIYKIEIINTINEVLYTVTNNGYSNCSFAVDWPDNSGGYISATSYALRFYTNSVKSNSTFTCSVALFQETHYLGNGGKWTCDYSQVYRPNNYTLIDHITYCTGEQAAVLYALVDDDVRLKLLDGTYAAISAAAMYYALKAAPAVDALLNKFTDNALAQAAIGFFGTSSIATIFSGSIFSELEKSQIKSASSNFTNPMMATSFFITSSGGGYTTSYSTWTGYPYATSPAGYKGSWSTTVR